MSAATWRGPDSLRAALVPLRSLQVDPKNARKHGKRNIEAIRASLREFGQRKPIVVREGVCVAGSGTLQAADLEGWEEIAVVDAGDLTVEQAAAYAVADNQSSDLAEWNPEELKATLGALPDTLKPLTGFSSGELSSIASMTFEKSAPEKKEEEAEFATIKVTRDQYVIIKGACARVMQSEGPDVTEARALELICAEYMAG